MGWPRRAAHWAPKEDDGDRGHMAHAHVMKLGSMEVVLCRFVGGGCGGMCGCTAEACHVVRSRDSDVLHMQCGICRSCRAHPMPMCPVYEVSHGGGGVSQASHTACATLTSRLLSSSPSRIVCYVNTCGP